MNTSTRNLMLEVQAELSTAVAELRHDIDLRDADYIDVDIETIEHHVAHLKRIVAAYREFN